MSPAEKLMPLLDKVRSTGPGRWACRCPAHDDGSPSLSVRELDDGRLLLHCFGGCDVGSVVAAVGLSLEDLFPARGTVPGGGSKAERRPFSAADLIELAAHESAVAVLVVHDLMQQREDADVDRLIEAARRLGEVEEVIHARR